MTVEPVIMDAKTAAKYLGLAVQTLARWRVEGRGPAHLKLGGCVRYHVRDLDAWLATRRRSSTVDTADGAHDVESNAAG